MAALIAGLAFIAFQAIRGAVVVVIVVIVVIVIVVIVVIVIVAVVVIVGVLSTSALIAGLTLVTQKTRRDAQSNALLEAFDCARALFGRLHDTPPSEMIETRGHPTWRAARHHNHRKIDKAIRIRALFPGFRTKINPDTEQSRIRTELQPSWIESGEPARTKRSARRRRKAAVGEEGGGEPSPGSTATRNQHYAHPCCPMQSPWLFFFRGGIIKLLTVQEILDEEHVQKM